MDKVIEVTGLKKSYGNVEAVKGVDFYVERGKLFAFLGPNGAGKSTTIDMVSTILKPDAGRVVIDGHLLGKEDAAIRSKIGIVFQDSLLDGLLTVEENLMTRGSFYGLDGAVKKAAVARAVAAAGAEEFLRRRYGKLSGGQRRRADIARALVNTPQILFLDEPTTGLDPQTRKKVWDMVRELQRREGMTVFLTTHYMEEAAAADYVIILDHGMVRAKGTPVELKEQYAADVLKISPKEGGKVEAYLEGQGLAYQKSGTEINVPLRHTVEALPLVETLGNYFAGFEVIRGSMDDVFLNITGEEIRD